MKSLPKSLQVPDDGWTETTEKKRHYELVLESEFQDIGLSQEISCTYQNIAKQVISALSNQALDTSSVNIFHHLLSESTIIKISEWTTERLVKLGHTPTNIDKYKRFLGTQWLRS